MTAQKFRKILGGRAMYLHTEILLIERANKKEKVRGCLLLLLLWIADLFLLNRQSYPEHTIHQHPMQENVLGQFFVMCYRGHHRHRYCLYLGWYCRFYPLEEGHRRHMENEWMHLGVGSNVP